MGYHKVVLVEKPCGYCGLLLTGKKSMRYHITCRPFVKTLQNKAAQNKYLARLEKPATVVKELSAAAIERSLKNGMCARHPLKKANKMGLCETCLARPYGRPWGHVRAIE